MDRGAWRATICGRHKESDTTEQHTFSSAVFNLLREHC